jgi:hypothetical protein
MGVDGLISVTPMDKAHENTSSTGCRGDLSIQRAVTDFCGTWLQLSNRSPKIVAAYRVDLSQFCSATGGEVYLVDVSRHMVESWLLSLQQSGYLAASLRRKLASVGVSSGIGLIEAFCNTRRFTIYALPSDQHDGCLVHFRLTRSLPCWKLQKIVWRTVSQSLLQGRSATEILRWSAHF